MKRTSSKLTDEIEENKKKFLLNNEFFNVYPINSFNKKFPFYSRPKEIGHFSLNSTRQLSIDQSQLKYLKPTLDKNNINFDLRVGYKNFIQKTEEEKLDNLLKWIKQSNMNFHEENINLICWRGLLTKIMCMPYENKESYRIAVVKFNDILYLCEFKTEENATRKLNETEKEMCYWGFRFENYMTYKSTEADIFNDSVNTNEEYAIVVKTKLDDLNILMGAEVDCCHSENLTSYVELKTNRNIENNRQMYNFKRFKLVKWWAQSFLIGIDKIICGFRNDYGLVTSFDTFETIDIPKMVKGINNTWEAAICFNFLLEFLKFIIKVVIKDFNKAIYVFNWSPHSNITYTVEDIDSNYAFLPNWYTDNFQ